MSVIIDPQFYTYAISGAFAFSGLFAYVAASPLVFMGVYKIDGKTYGKIFALLSVGFIGSSQVNSALLKKHKSEEIIPLALLSQVIIAVSFYIGASLNYFNLYATIGFIFLFLCCVGLTNPNAAALSLAPFSRNAGTASSLMGAMQLGIGALASVAVGMFTANSAVPIAAIMAITSILALLILFFGRKKIGKLSSATLAPLPPIH